MSEIKLNDNNILKNYGKPYIVAELNTSHFGDIEKAKEMVKAAKSSGCDCVKFQSWTEETIYSKSYYDKNPIAKRFVKKFSFSENTLLELSDYCNIIGISFASTPYSLKEVDFLVKKCKVPFIKVASMDITSHYFLEHIAKQNIPIVLSTGMADLHEIEQAVSIIESTGNENICILHCVSIYPPEIQTLNLKNITGLSKTFSKYPIGYSDHSLGIEMPSASVALGACLIEKHFTLDNGRIGMDNQMAIQPDEMTLLVKNCLNVYSALGDESRKVLDKEIDQRINMRRSIVTKESLKAGDIIELKKLDFKRPGHGISPIDLDKILGKKVIKDIEKDTIINMEDLSS